MRTVIAQNAITAGSLQYLLLSDGVLIPIRAKRKLENPTTSSEVQNQDTEAMTYAQANGTQL